MDVFDATETPRARRGDIELLNLAETLDYMDAVRRRTVEVLERIDLRAARKLYEMVLQHEHQHNETMLQCIQLADARMYSLAPAAPSTPPPPGPEMVRVEGGPFLMGDAGPDFAYDNERERHEVDVAAFEIDRLPVTNGAYTEFVEDGGYARGELWAGRGLGVAPRRGCRAAAVLDRGRARAPLRPARPARPVAAGDARVVVRGRRFRALGGQAPAYRGRVGEGRGVGTRRHRAAAFPWGDEPATHGLVRPSGQPGVAFGGQVFAPRWSGPARARPVVATGRPRPPRGCRLPRACRAGRPRDPDRPAHAARSDVQVEPRALTRAPARG